MTIKRGDIIDILGADYDRRARKDLQDWKEELSILTEKWKGGII